MRAAFATISRQTTWGIVLILLPATAIIIGLPITAAVTAGTINPFLAGALTLIISVPAGWLYWSVTVGHWLLHALSRTPQEYWLELYETAVSKQLLWPLESSFNRTILVLPKYADLYDYSLITIVNQQRAFIQQTLLETLPQATFFEVSRVKVRFEAFVRVALITIMTVAAMSSDIWVLACIILLIIFPYTAQARRRLLQVFRTRGDGLYVSDWGIYSDDARAIYLPWYNIQRLDYDDQQQQVKVLYSTGHQPSTKTIYCAEYKAMNYRWFKNVLVAYWHHRYQVPAGRAMGR